MKPGEFNKKYDGQYKMTATYKDKYGYTVKGLLLDKIQTSVLGTKFVYIDSFANTVKIDDLIDIKKTNTKWLDSDK